jgi:hypothetical protein
MLPADPDYRLTTTLARTVAGPICMNSSTGTASFSSRSFHRTRPRTIPASFVTAQIESVPRGSSARTCSVSVVGRHVAVGGRST